MTTARKELGALPNIAIGGIGATEFDWDPQKIAFDRMLRIHRGGNRAGNRGMSAFIAPRVRVNLLALFGLEKSFNLSHIQADTYPAAERAIAGSGGQANLAALSLGAPLALGIADRLPDSVGTIVSYNGGFRGLVAGSALETGADQLGPETERLALERNTRIAQGNKVARLVVVSSTRDVNVSLPSAMPLELAGPETDYFLLADKDMTSEQEQYAELVGAEILYLSRAPSHQGILSEPAAIDIAAQYIGAPVSAAAA